MWGREGLEEEEAEMRGMESVRCCSGQRGRRRLGGRGASRGGEQSPVLLQPRARAPRGLVTWTLPSA